ncbi:MAG: DUF2891 domain-containing protein [Candidatus Eisenbacteria bacterium]
MMSPQEDLSPFVEMAMSALQREYPYHLTIVLQRDEDAIPPRRLTPAFFGAFDWHSAVHGHWCLVRALRMQPGAPWSTRARTLLSRSLTETTLAIERTHLMTPGREGFERPYGLAWLLQLASELRGWNDPAAPGMVHALAPLEAIAAQRLTGWLDRSAYPVRSGEHSQSAFALGLLFDWARDTGNAELLRQVTDNGRRLYGADRDAPIAYEPSAHDFLSPILAEADLMRRITPWDSFADWLTRFLPQVSGTLAERWLAPVNPVDRTDGKLAHLDGLNLSRAWMLEGIACALPAAHAHRLPMLVAAERNRTAGLAGARGSHYMGTHWLGSFAVYLLTKRGLGPALGG